ncbi:MAG: MrcB family domain-containing protein [Pirellula sp.]
MSSSYGDYEEEEFWSACLLLLEKYPHRPEKFSGDSEAVRLVRRLRELAKTEANELCPNSYWKGDASVGKGNWTNVPWLAVFDERETTSAQKGVYPVFHFSCDEPVGIRIGLGVAATEFKDDPEGKAREVYGQLLPSTVELLRELGFSDVIEGI